MSCVAPPPQPPNDPLAERLRRLPRASLRTLERVVGHARALAIPIAWVGGGVRDLFLGRAHPDLDLVVEADPHELARAIGESLRGSVHVHDRFATASVVSDDVRIDLARARRETYPEPGALPLVTPAPLAEDLHRRDFSINAMALRFPQEPTEPLELLDPLGGLHDLGSGRLRVLHARSFLDDPTRILRGVGFELRFGYRLDPESERRARGALTEDTLERLSGERLWKALARTLERPAQIGPALSRLRELGVLSHLLPSSADVDASIAYSAAVARVHAERAPREEEGIEVFLIAVGAGLPRSDRAALRRRLALPARWATSLLESPERVAEARRALTGTPRPHEVAERLAAMSAIEIAATVALGDDRVADWVARWTSDLRHRDSGLRAADLLAAGIAPGPAIGLGLRAARRACIDGDVDRSEQLAVALAVARRELS